MTHTNLHSTYRWLIPSLAACLLLGAGMKASAADEPAKKPTHRVAAMYFHRTTRCDTCKKISAYIEEAVKVGMAKQMKSGQVTLHMIDFQDEKNAKFAKFYKIKGPTLVVADVRDGKVTEWKAMPKVWSLVFEKDKFLPYVQEAISGYLEEK